MYVPSLDADQDVNILSNDWINPLEDDDPSTSRGSFTALARAAAAAVTAAEAACGGFSRPVGGAGAFNALAPILATLAVFNILAPTPAPLAFP